MKRPGSGSVTSGVTEPLLALVINLSTTGTTAATTSTSHQSHLPRSITADIVVICILYSVTIIDTGRDQHLQDL